MKMQTCATSLFSLSNVLSVAQHLDQTSVEKKEMLLTFSVLKKSLDPTYLIRRVDCFSAVVRVIPLHSQVTHARLRGISVVRGEEEH
jgi:hypothetical protein